MGESQEEAELPACPAPCPPACAGLLYLRMALAASAQGLGAGVVTSGDGSHTVSLKDSTDCTCMCR